MQEQEEKDQGPVPDPDHGHRVPPLLEVPLEALALPGTCPAFEECDLHNDFFRDSLAAAELLCLSKEPSSRPATVS